MTTEEFVIPLSLGYDNTAAEVEQALQDSYKIIEDITYGTPHKDAKLALINNHIVWLFKQLAVADDYDLAKPSGLPASQFNPVTSPDHLLRWYSWDTGGGGTMRDHGSIAHFTYANANSRFYRTYHDKIYRDLLDPCCDVNPYTYRLEQVKIGQEDIYLRFYLYVLSGMNIIYEIEAITRAENPEYNPQPLEAYPLFLERSGAEPQSEIKYEYDGTASYGTGHKYRLYLRPDYDAERQELAIPDYAKIYKTLAAADAQTAEHDSYDAVFLQQLIAKQPELKQKLYTYYRFDGQHFVRVANSDQHPPEQE